jgi:hypothetical protein
VIRERDRAVLEELEECWRQERTTVSVTPIECALYDKIITLRTKLNMQETTFKRKKGNIASHIEWVKHKIASWPKWKQEIAGQNMSISAPNIDTSEASVDGVDISKVADDE